MAGPKTSEILQHALQHHQAGRLPEAEPLYREVLARDSGNWEALHYLGLIAHQVGRNEIAVELIGQAATLASQDATIRSNLGEVYRHLGRFDDALASLQEAILLRPDFANAHNNLGLVYKDLCQPEEALACFRAAIELKPDFAEVHNNIGLVLMERGWLENAIESYARALALKPELADAQSNLGRALKDRGLLDEAIACFRRALTLQPDRADFHSNLILNLLYRSDRESEVLVAELQRWTNRHARPLAGLILPHSNDPSPDRPLRIGYVSYDFRLHSAAFFLLPLLQSHNHEDYHVTCYSNSAGSDNVTEQFRTYADSWRSLVGLSDETVAQLVREDRIDVLVDLSGHTAGNRLPVFARQPAPVQVSYLGYPASTGLDRMHYRFTDAWADPPEATVEFYSEELVRLPDSAWCFAPLSGSPPVNELPAVRHGHVTFGCFNNWAKVTDEMLQLWARILQRVPGARLRLKNSAVGSQSLAQRLDACFSARGISLDRLDLLPHQASTFAHLECYHRLDIALDTFPYHGTTTTCEALWMGVPVLTLAGDRHLSRVGVSLLTNIGLPEFITRNPEAYVDAAVSATSDLPRLATLRVSLRDRMQRSALMDAPRFARAIESAYRSMWQRWCAQSAPFDTSVQ